MYMKLWECTQTKKTNLEQTNLGIFKSILNTVPRPLLIKASYFVKPFVALYLKGGSYTDPIDGKSFRKFLPYGYGTQRENALSPSTLSLERHRLLWLFLKEETDFFGLKNNTKPCFSIRENLPKNQLRMLHMAPEQCFLKPFKKLENIDYITADLYSPIADVKSDICDLPFESDSFDVVLCNHVLEHVPDDAKAMQELFRVLKPGGLGVFQVPQDLTKEITFEDPTITDPKERAQLFGQYDHVRVYGLDYFDKLRDAGFVVHEIDYTKKIAPELVKRFCLTPGELLPVCTKN
jgi:SAM-dependent methyltransferase